jgi:hypothetical protein
MTPAIRPCRSCGFSAFTDNAIGWIFSAIALLAVTGQMAGEDAVYAYATRPGSLPGRSWPPAWHGSWPWWLVLALALVVTPLLLSAKFPAEQAGRTLQYRPECADPCPGGHAATGADGEPGGLLRP